MKNNQSNRERLLNLEKEGKYVFHGSSEQIDILLPRQAKNNNLKTKQMENDGEPAVFATPYAEIAIFRALINQKDVSGKSQSAFGINGQKLYFSATKNLLEKAKNKIGKVYILNKEKFTNFEGMQCRCKEAIVPIDVIEVTAQDLPNNIKTTRLK